MKIERKLVKIRDLVKNYNDDGEGGVYGYDNKLTIRPAYQREFVYSDKQRDAVLDTVKKRYPLNVIYWNKISDDKFEVLDGQQRIISICQYVNGDYSIDFRFWHNLTDDEKNEILDYDLDVYICEGTESDKLNWFRTINIAGVVLTNQELLNATYSGPFLSDAKTIFSKRNSVAGQLADGYISGNPIRQDYLEKALRWISDRGHLENIAEYMALHQKDKDANSLWIYFQNVINWAKTLFPKSIKGITNNQEWGLLYNKYMDNEYNTNELNKKLNELLLDEDVLSHKGIIPYLLSDRKQSDEKHLNIRVFPNPMKRRAYTKQGGICPLCKKEGTDKKYSFEEMEADHIVAWSEGGKTVEENLQMLCKKHNRDKGDK